MYHPCKLKILSNHDPKKPAEHFFFGDIFEQRYYQVYKYYCGKELEIAAISGQKRFSTVLFLLLAIDYSLQDRVKFRFCDTALFKIWKICAIFAKIKN